jgi:hypothetical protein
MADHYEEQRVQQSVDYISVLHSKKILGIEENIQALRRYLPSMNPEGQERAHKTIESLQMQLNALTK